MMVIAMAVLMCVGVAQADIYCNWFASWGFYAAGGGATGLLGPDGSGNVTLAQLIASVDGVADDATPGGGVSGDDILLASFVVIEDGVDNTPDTYDYWASFDAPDYWDAGAHADGLNIYGRIFEEYDITQPNSGIDQGDFYFVGSVVAANNLSGTPPPTPQDYNINDAGDRIDEGWTASGEMNDGLLGEQVVPEPATIGLFALGAALIGLRRRRR